MPRFRRNFALALALISLPALAKAQVGSMWVNDWTIEDPARGPSDASKAARQAAAGDVSAILRMANPEKSSVTLEAMTLSVRAMALVVAGRRAEAAADCARAEKSLAARYPQAWDAQTCRNLACAYADLGNYPAYFNMLRRVFRHAPNQAESFNALAWALATCPRPQYRNGREAVTLAESACQRTDWKDLGALDTLAAALAEAGRWDDAVRRQGEALAIARQKVPSLVGKLEKHLALYRAHKPLRVEFGPAGHCRGQFARS